jgi:hypothetical protein
LSSLAATIRGAAATIPALVLESRDDRLIAGRFSLVMRAIIWAMLWYESTPIRLASTVMAAIAPKARISLPRMLAASRPTLPSRLARSDNRRRSEPKRFMVISYLA